MTTTTTTTEILHSTTTFMKVIISQPEHRRRLFSTLQSKFPSPDQIHAIATLENAISTTAPSFRTSSLRAVEKLLLSYPDDDPFSSFVLSIIYGLCHRPVESALSLLNVFCFDPSFARCEIAPMMFEELFIIHLIPVLEWLKDQRSNILSSLSPNLDYQSDEWSRSGEESVVIPCTKLLSRMNEEQAVELTKLERDYEEVLDENCSILAGYFKEVLGNKDGNQLINLPVLVFRNARKGDTVETGADEKKKAKEMGIKGARYNPIWAGGGGEHPVEVYSESSSNNPKLSPSYPQRVSLSFLTNQNSSRELKTSSNSHLDSQNNSSSDDKPSSWFLESDSEAETQEKSKEMASFDSRRSRLQKQKEPSSSSESSSRSSAEPSMAESANPPGGGKNTPPKDFVCPITTHLFDDPVTLETGQTYERKAIQEWLDRGNSNCPITRQRLHSTQLPKTNYVLKRLIASWKELNPNLIPIQFDSVSDQVMPSTSPNSVISQASMEGLVSELRIAITKLCTSEILTESEMAVLKIERFWKEANLDIEIQNLLTKPPVINGFVEILFNSVDSRVLTATVFLLSELGSRERAVIHTLTRVDSDVECIVALFKKGLLEAVVLIYLLRPSLNNLIEMEMVESLLTTIKKNNDSFVTMCLNPKSVSVFLLGRIMGNSEESYVSAIAQTVISSNGVESIIGSLEAEWAEERIAAVRILLQCMEEDGNCRNIVADKAELAPVLESFLGASDGERFEIVHFLSELVKLNRRTFNDQILQIIKDEGSFSTMHTLLVYLQTAPQDHCPILAALLLQLDLLEEPRKMSMYREEAIDTLISCLRNSAFPVAQVAAAETILGLQGRFSSSGKPLLKSILLKRAKLDKRYKSLVSRWSAETLEEEKAAEEWERKIAFVLASHEFGLLFEALAEGMKSRYVELSSACFVAATWLVHMLSVLPDTGVRGAARVCLLRRFVSIFRSAKDMDDRALSMLALSSFINDPEGLHDLTTHMKDIMRGLRELKKSSVMAIEMLKVLSEGNESSADLWNHKELVQVDCSMHGEVLSIVCLKNKIISGHSDGTIKVWTGKGSILHPIQEIREHSKAVTSLAVLQPGDKLYSGSLDRTIRVWSIGGEVMHCVQVHDMKDQIHNLAVANSISCFIPQGAGVKVQSWNGGSKLLNPSKYVKCLALQQGKLYCGCQDNSIQEIDLATGTLSNIQTGSRKLLGKSNPINSLQVHDGLIYSASTAIDGAGVKIWSTSNYSMVGSLPSTVDVRAMTVGSELIYLGCKGGLVEVWSRDNHNRVETLQTGNHGKLNCMTLDGDENVLVTGTSNGHIQAWGLI